MDGGIESMLGDTRAATLIPVDLNPQLWHKNIKRRTTTLSLIPVVIPAKTR